MHIWHHEEALPNSPASIPLQTEDEITNVFRVWAMLHNGLLNYDGLDAIGSEEENWLSADLSTDDARIFAEVEARQNAERARHLPKGTGEDNNADDEDPEEDHFALRRALVLWLLTLSMQGGRERYCGRSLLRFAMSASVLVMQLEMLGWRMALRKKNR